MFAVWCLFIYNLITCTLQLFFESIILKKLAKSLLKERFNYLLTIQFNFAFRNNYKKFWKKLATSLSEERHSIYLLMIQFNFAFRNCHGKYWKKLAKSRLATCIIIHRNKNKGRERQGFRTKGEKPRGSQVSRRWIEGGRPAGWSVLIFVRFPPEKANGRGHLLTSSN